MILGTTALLLACSVWPQAADAGSPSSAARVKVVVLPVASTGDLKDHFRNELRGRLTAGLSRGDFEVVPSDVVCSDTECLKATAAEADAPYLVRMTVTAKERDYQITIDLIAAKDGKSATSSAQTCELCGIGEVGEVVLHQAAAIRSRLDALLLGAPMLAISSDPSEAMIYLDGELIGRTPLEREVTPGAHWAKATKDGYVSQEHQVESVAGVRESIAFTLDPVPRDRRKHLRRFGWAAVGIGGAGLVAGITLVAIDGRENKTICSGNDVDQDGDCRFNYDTLVPGIVTTVVGGALLATGIGIAIALRPKRSNRRAKASVLLVPNGANVTVSF